MTFYADRVCIELHKEEKRSFFGDEEGTFIGEPPFLTEDDKAYILAYIQAAEQGAEMILVHSDSGSGSVPPLKYRLFYPTAGGFMVRVTDSGLKADDFLAKFVEGIEPEPEENLLRGDAL